jgi:membrane protease YdiL (CAAX protease family)
MSLRLTQQSIPGLRIPFFSVTMYNFVMSVRQNTFSFLLPYTAILIGLNLLKNAWIAILLYHFLILVYLAVSGHLRDFKLIFHGWNSRLFLGSLGMSIIAGPALFILWNSMKLDNSNLSSLAHLKLDGLSWVLFMPYFALFHPVLEEVFWRSNPDNSKWNGYARDILFGGYHALVLVHFIKFEWLVISVMILCVVSHIWGVIFVKTRGLLIPVLSHILADLGIIVALNVILRNP